VSRLFGKMMMAMCWSTACSAVGAWFWSQKGGFVGNEAFIYSRITLFHVYICNFNKLTG